MLEVRPFGEVYVHTCTANEKSYVGQTTTGVDKRWRGHLKSARLPKALAYNNLFSNAIRKYGADAFEHRVLSIAKSAEELDNLEKIWIVLLHTQAPTGYNIQIGGSTWTPERIARMAARKREFSPEGHAALIKNGQARRGCKQPREAVEKVAAINRGRVKSFETRARLSAALMGHAVSAETRHKQSEAKLGKKQSLETRAKKSAAKSTPEARAANSARVKAQWGAKKVVQHGS